MIKKLHLCYDFDGVVTKRHCHSIDYLINNGIQAIKGEEDFAAVVRLAFSKGHKISITSYNEEKVCRKGLLVAGLEKEELARICFVCKVPQTPHIGKNFHIERAIEHHGISDDEDYITVLVDDSRINTIMARAAGHAAIFVPSTEYYNEFGVKNRDVTHDLTHLDDLRLVILNPHFTSEVSEKRFHQTEKTGYTRAVLG